MIVYDFKDELNEWKYSKSYKNVVYRVNGNNYIKKWLRKIFKKYEEKHPKSGLQRFFLS